MKELLNSTPICPKFDENTFLVMTEVELCWKEEAEDVKWIPKQSREIAE